MIFQLIFLFLSFACHGADRLEPLPPVQYDGSPSPDVELADVDDSETIDGDDDEIIDGDEAEAEPLLECGYPEGEYGHGEDRALEPFWLRTCDGELTSLPRLWCEQKVTIVHFTTAYCGSCYTSTNEVNRLVHDELADDPVVLVEVLLFYQPQEIPGSRECTFWTEYFSPPVTTYVPATMDELDSALLLHSWAEPLPYTVVIDEEGIIRLWSVITLPPDFAEQVRALLAP